MNRAKAQPETNGKKTLFSRDTVVPWSFATAFGVLGWVGAMRVGEINATIASNAEAARKDAAGVAEKVSAANQRRELDFQAINFKMEAQSERTERIEKAVEALGRQVDALGHKDTK